MKSLYSAQRELKFIFMWALWESGKITSEEFLEFLRGK
jgi:hypothetical protein